MRSAQQNSEERLFYTLMTPVWGLTPPDPRNPRALEKYEAQPYFDHHKSLLNNRSLIREDEITLGRVNKQCEKVVQIVQVVRENWQQPISKIKAAMVASNQPVWLVHRDDSIALSKIVDFAVRLWLFMPLETEKIAQKQGDELIASMKAFDDSTIPQEMQNRLPSHGKYEGILSFDLTLENLVRKAGLVFCPTSDLGQHLVMDDRVVYFFCHVKAIEKFQCQTHHKIYPKDFLDEVCRTIRLFFPNKGSRGTKRTKSFSKKKAVDVNTDHEAHIGLKRLNQLNLATYPYFGDRLQKLQDRYNRATPRTFKQMWFDRREPVDWMIMWVAVVVFVLTLIFGLISSIMSILQVVLR